MSAAEKSVAELADWAHEIARDVNEMIEDSLTTGHFPTSGIGSLSLSVMLLAEAVQLLAAEAAGGRSG